MNKEKRWPDKIIVGLTGNIATGKSAIMKMARDKGAMVLDADKVVHGLMNSSNAIRETIEAKFGSTVRRGDGQINRPVLAKIVFNDPNALRELEAILHPAVHQEIFRRIDETEADVTVIEAIKLLEGGLVDLCDAVWVPNCSEQRQMDRLIICRGLDESSARMRIKAQAPQADKVARADVVIDTSGTLDSTRQQVDDAWAELFVADDDSLPIGSPEAEARRARSSDVPGILLLIHKATNGAVKLKRAELLMAFSERSYFIGQLGSDMTCVLGAYIDSGIARIDQIYTHPADAIRSTMPAVLEAIEKSAVEHFCEIILAFISDEQSEDVQTMLTAFGYDERTTDEMHRVWKRAAEESQPENTRIMLKVLRDIRKA